MLNYIFPDEGDYDSRLPRLYLKQTGDTGYNKAGDTYTFSCEAWADADTEIAFGAGYSNFPGDYDTAQITTEHKNIVITHTIKRNSSSENYGVFFIRFKNDRKNIYLRNIKLERGSIATAWSPAPEDINSDISKYRYLANALQEAAKNGSTSIEGGLMLTSLIELLDPTSREVNAGISGVIENEGATDNALLWAGGNYAQALSAANGSGNLPVIITKNGIDSIIGALRVVDSTTVEVYTPNVGRIRIDTNSDGIKILDSNDQEKIVIVPSEIDNYIPEGIDTWNVAYSKLDIGNNISTNNRICTFTLHSTCNVSIPDISVNCRGIIGTVSGSTNRISGTGKIKILLVDSNRTTIWSQVSIFSFSNSDNFKYIINICLIS